MFILYYYDIISFIVLWILLLIKEMENKTIGDGNVKGTCSLLYVMFGTLIHFFFLELLDCEI